MTYDCTSVEAVIDRLEEIVAQGRAQRDASGYFAALYLAVTRRVERAIELGRFHDGERMTNIDIAFAQRYFDAFEAQRAPTERPTRTWSIAFKALHDERSTHAQSLTLSSVAHIGLDLPITMAELCTDALRSNPDPRLKEDFDVLNDILGELVPKVSEKISSISPVIAIIDKALFFLDEAFIRFSVRAAREKAWRNACALAQGRKSVEALELGTAEFARAVDRPAWPLKIALLIIRLFEVRDPSRVYAALLDER